MKITKSYIENGKYVIRHIYDYDINTHEKVDKYIQIYGLEDYLGVRIDFFQKKINRDMKKAGIVFVVCFLMCILIYYIFEGYLDVINKKIYDLFVFLKIPIRNPYGWNFSYLFSFLFLIYCVRLIIFDKVNFVFFVRVARLKWMSYIKFFFSFIIIFFSFLLSVMVFYISPDLSSKIKVEGCVGLWSGCFMRTEDMFFYSTFTNFVAAFCASFSLYLIVVPWSPKYSQVSNYRSLK